MKENVSGCFFLNSVCACNRANPRVNVKGRDSHAQYSVSADAVGLDINAKDILRDIKCLCFYLSTENFIHIHSDHVYLS